MVYQKFLFYFVLTISCSFPSFHKFQMMPVPLGKEQIKQISDNDLVARIVQGGEKQLQHVIYDRYADKVFHKCISLCKDRNTAQDLMHDIMVKILTNLAKFKGTSDFSFWVYSITYNYCMDFLRKKKRKITVETGDSTDFEDVPVDEIEKENRVLKELRLDQLERLFAELNTQEKAILLMRYQDSKGVKEIAKVLNISESAVKMRLKRSRDRLAELLKAEDYEE